MCGPPRISGVGAHHQPPGAMTVPPRTLPIKLLLATLLALTTAVTMGTAATVFVANDVARHAAFPTERKSSATGDSSATVTPGRDLADGTLQAVAANQAFPPAVRMAAIRNALVGGCHSTREVLFGATAIRRAAVQSMLTSVADLPRAATIAPLTLRALEIFTTGTTPTPNVAGPANQRWSALVSRFIPTAVRNRRAFCERS